MLMTVSHSSSKDDLSLSEVMQLGLRYGRIPLALILVEIIYWFLTMPSDSLALIQVTEAWIWNAVTNLLYGEGTSTLSTHNGWLTRIDFHHSAFPGPFDSVGLYVSDECAGVHEMIFLSTLIWMTDGVPQKLKLKSIFIGCSLVYLLNILRLVVFYPIALDSCLASPNQPECLQPMWEFHTMVYEYGFLIVLVLLWLIWFWMVGGPSRTEAAAFDSHIKNTIALRRNWTPQLLTVLGFCVLLMISSFVWIGQNDEANEAKQTLEWCEFSELVSPSCQDAQATWDNAIETAWSIGVLGGLGCILVLVTIGPGEVEAPTSEDPTKKGKPKGSWRHRSSSEEE